MRKILNLGIFLDGAASVQVTLSNEILKFKDCLKLSH